MTRDDVKKVLGIINASYSNFKVENKTETIETWFWLLESYETEKIMAGLKAYMQTNENGFPPSVSELIHRAHAIDSPEELSESEAWYLVQKASRNSSYKAIGEYAGLPKLVQRVVGSPGRLQFFAGLDDTQMAVESSNFMRIYRGELERERRYQKMSQDLRDHVDAINQGSDRQRFEAKQQERLEGIKDNQLLETEQEPQKYVEAPEDMLDKIREILEEGDDGQSNS